MDFFGSSDSGDGSDGSSSLLNGILNSVTQLGQTAILSSQAPQVNTTYPYRPPATYTTGGALSPFGVGGASGIGSSGLLFFGVIAVAFLFLFRK